ncbi:MAG: aa3-type cytochrome c oxidase subunit IV [Alphaproteobacteria bacterium]|nr:aa3-type cytochrome c oxidase subunit IV [Alphaproteobacteria bacterium]
MASSGHHQRGEMDIAEQVSTFEFFNTMTKWGSLFVGSLVLFLVLWFCTGAGFGGAAVTVAVVLALGVTFLRSRAGEAGAH